MRRFTSLLLALIGLCLLTTGCGTAAPEPTAARTPDSVSCPDWGHTEPALDDALSASVAEVAESGGPAAEFSRAETPTSTPLASGDREPPRERSVERRQLRGSGTLTAGSIDDVERSDEFCQFFGRTIESGMFARPVKDARPRVMLQVTTSGGIPVGGAELTIDSSGAQGGPLRLTTGSDGRAMLTASDLDVQTQRCGVTVRPPDGSRPFRRELSLENDVCRVVVDDFETQRPTQLDLALIIDTTGSMGDELEYLKTEIDDIVARLRETFPNVDQRFALIVYRDQRDQYVSRRFDFTDSLDDLRGKLSRQGAAGGGDMPEAVHVALEQAASLDWRPGNVARVAFLVGDAPPHDSDMLAAFEAANGLRAGGVRLYPVASSGVDLKAEFVMRSAALLTMGQYLFLTDHSGIGNPHAKPHTSQYLVEHLDQLMVRMITSELCGRRLQADEVLAIERGDMALPYGPGPILPGQEQVSRQTPQFHQAASLSLPEGTGLWLTLGAALLGVCLYDSIRSRQEA